MSVLGKALVFIGVGFALLCLLGVFFSVKQLQKGVEEMRPVSACMVEGTALRDALIKYANRNGGRLPSTTTWTQDAKDEFLRRRKELIALDVSLRGKEGVPWSDDDGPWGCHNGSRIQAFQYNADLAGTELKAIKNPQKTVLIFETPDTTNGAKKYERRGDRTQPQVLGQLRDWLVMPISGKMQDLVGTGQGSPASR